MLKALQFGMIDFIELQVSETFRAGACGNPIHKFADLTAAHGKVTVSGRFKLANYS